MPAPLGSSNDRDAAKDRLDSSRDFSDWSRKGPLPDLPSQGRQTSRGFSRGNFDNASDAGSERGGSRRSGFPQDDKVRDFGNWERKGPLAPPANAGPPSRDGGKMREGSATGERMQSPAWGEGRAEGGSRPPRRDFQERPPVERAPTAADQDGQWRSGMRPDASPAPTPDASTPSSPQQQQQMAPKERPRLNLAKRSVSTAEPDSATSSSDSKASPFGAARPIDTATREREVEEKRQLAIRQKRDADEKVKEDKSAREAAAKARGPGPQDGSDKVTSPTAEGGNKKGPRQQNGAKGAPKENGDAAAQRDRPAVSILKRDAEGGDVEQGADDVPDASANGTIVGDKETKPQEIVKEVPADDNDAEAAAESTEGTAQAMEDDGWSTVATKQKSSRRGGARALAS